MPTARPRFLVIACLVLLLSAFMALPVSAQKSSRSTECQGTCWSAERGVWSSDQPAAPPAAEVKDESAARPFTLPESSGAVDVSGTERSELDMTLGLVGLPGMGGAEADESTYERASRMQSDQRQTYGERYRRNPDGSYGAQSSSRWNGGNVADRLLEQALSAGGGYFSSWAEGWLAGYGNARISVRINDKGDVTGAGDFLLPLYGSEFSTFFTQMGLRTMSGDRVIGNFGLGQRFFPAENLAFGYNAFIDQDFLRNHTRGGVGLEAWYDWLRLSANYYAPLSGWKDSEDYDSRLVEERPAEGFDARLTGYLPFYRNLAVTGAFEKWKGDHVGTFGRDDFLNKNPKMWSYGLEWTPVPILSASVNQRHSGGHDETQFGLTFNYHFDMSWEDQISSSAVAELRTVEGSRHEFVNRQNEIILEYRVKDRVKGGVSGNDVISGLQAGLNILIRNAGGSWRVLSGNNFTSADFVTAAMSATGGLYSAVELWVVDAPAGCDNTGCAVSPTAGTVDWTIDMVGNPTAGFYWPRGSTNDVNGLSWQTPLQLSDSTQPANTNISSIPGAAGGNATTALTDIVGSRSITIKVSVNGGTPHSETFAFGAGPLSVFGNYNPDMHWANTDNIMTATSTPAATTACGGNVSVPVTSWPPTGNPAWESTDVIWRSYYAIGSKLPKAVELQAVAGYRNSYNPSGRGAALAAGWSVANYWSGEVRDDGVFARVVHLASGLAAVSSRLDLDHQVVCRP